MATVTAVEAKGDKAAILVLDDGVRVWTPEKEKADPLVGKPIPSDWTMKEGNYGPQAFPPRPKDGRMPAAFRNSKEGQLYEQERMDRRTALMQAVAVDSGVTLELADKFYGWLRATAGVGVPPPSGVTPSVAPAPASSSPEANSGSDEGPRGSKRVSTGEASKGGGQPREGEAAPCAHIDTSPLTPDGRALPAGRLRCLNCGLRITAL